MPLSELVSLSASPVLNIGSPKLIIDTLNLRHLRLVASHRVIRENGGEK